MQQQGGVGPGVGSSSAPTVGSRLSAVGNAIAEKDITLPKCCNKRCMGALTKVFAIIIGPLLILVGVLNFIFNLFGNAISPPPTGTVTENDPYMFACVMFSMYSVLFGVLIVFSSFVWKAFLNNFTFLKTHFGRSMFYILTGTLCMGSGSYTQRWCQVLGWIIGGFVAGTGFIQLVIMCMDRNPSPEPAPQAQAPPLQPSHPYEASRQGPDGNPFDVPPNNALYVAQQDPQFRAQSSSLVGAAGASVAASMMAGGSQQDALASAASNPEVQRAAMGAALAAAQNPQVRAAATRAISGGVQSAVGSAYDKLFGDAQ